MKLTPKQLRFCQEYMLDGNATAAAERAGYSARCAKEIGYENLTKPHVAAEIAERRSRQQQVADVTVAEVLGRLRADGSTRATELLGKHIGMWPQKVDVTHDAAETLVERLERLAGE